MKKLLLFFCLAANIGYALAQTGNCSQLQIKEGNTLVYTTITQPLFIANADYFKAKPKEREKIKEEFFKKTKPTVDIQTNYIKRITPASDGSVTIETSVKRGKTPVATSYYGVCKGNDMVVLPLTVSVNETTNAVDSTHFYNIVYHPTDKRKIGFTMLFDRIVPNQLEVGQKLPDYMSRFAYTTTGPMDIKLPQREEVSRTVTSHVEVGATGRVTELYKTVESKYATTEIDVMVEMSNMNETWYKNREVKEKKEVTVSGKTYTAYMLREEIWTSQGFWQVKSDNAWVQKKNQKGMEKGQKNVEELLKKEMNANEDGYIVTVTESWMIPGIGAYAMKSYDTWGKESGYLELKEIK